MITLLREIMNLSTDIYDYAEIYDNLMYSSDPLREGYIEECKNKLTDSYAKVKQLEKITIKNLDEIISNEDDVERRYKVNLTKRELYPVKVKSKAGIISFIYNDVMLHRNTPIRRSMYENSTMIEGKAFMVKRGITEPLKKAFVCFEHVYAYDVNEQIIRDNDNYNVLEQKQLLDAIVTIGMLESDRGEDCQIMNITTRGDETKTIIHIIPYHMVNRFLRQKYKYQQ